MKNRKKIDWPKHGIVLTITILVFATGIFLGSYINSSKLSGINELSEELRLNVMSSELEFTILSENPCEVSDVSFLSDELDEITERVDFMESQLGRTNPEVLKLKNFYNIVQLRHYLLMTRLIEQCDYNLTNIVYFYSNVGDCPSCREQGFILSYLRNVEPINVYSIDINSDNRAVRALKEIYEIKTTPSFIINSETHEGYKNLEELRELIN